MRGSQFRSLHASKPQSEMGGEMEPKFVNDSQSSAVPPRTGYTGKTSWSKLQERSHDKPDVSSAPSDAYTNFESQGNVRNRAGEYEKSAQGGVDRRPEDMENMYMRNFESQGNVRDRADAFEKAARGEGVDT